MEFSDLPPSVDAETPRSGEFGEARSAPQTISALATSKTATVPLPEDSKVAVEMLPPDVLSPSEGSHVRDTIDCNEPSSGVMHGSNEVISMNNLLNTSVLKENPTDVVNSVSICNNFCKNDSVYTKEKDSVGISESDDVTSDSHHEIGKRSNGIPAVKETDVLSSGDIALETSERSSDPAEEIDSASALEGKDDTSDPQLNPFVHRIHFRFPYDYIKVALLTLVLVPVRVFFISLSIILAYCVSSVGLYGLTQEQLSEKPFTGWRRRLRWLMGFCGRFMTRSYGFHVMSVKGTQAPASEAPIIVVAPHSSFFDGLAGYWSKVPGLVSRIENSYIPCFGKFITYTQPVFVLRDDVSSRQQSINEIKKRVNSSDGWPQIMVFPEGTCTNRSCLITFKPGAFYPGVPVQPVVMRYLNSMDTTTWTWDGPGALKLIWLTMTQFHNFCQLEYLPVYYPNEEEKKDARLYAANVRAVMAKALGVPVVDYTYDDCRIMDKARKSKLPPCIGLIEFQKLRQKYGFTIKDVEKCMTAQFSGMADKDGLLRLPGLSRYLHLPATEPTLVHLFNLIDSNGKGAVSFREYLLGYWDIVKPIIKDEIVNIAFKQLDPDEKGKITRDDLTTVLNAIFFLSKKESDQIFDELDVNKNKIITYEDFLSLSEWKGEYVWLLLRYQESVRAGIRQLSDYKRTLESSKTKFE